MFLLWRMRGNHASDEDHDMDDEREESQVGESHHDDSASAREGEALSVNDMWDDLQWIKWPKGSLPKSSGPRMRGKSGRAGGLGTVSGTSPDPVGIVSRDSRVVPT
jgi:hypothetical protein